jgi:hypothetical protein
MNAFTRTRPETCLSDRTLDMLAAGELSTERLADVERHLAECDACASRRRAIDEGKAAFERESPKFSELARPRRPAGRLWAFGATLAAAAALVLALRVPRDEGSLRTKGAEHVGFFVEHGGVVREGVASEVVAPGDRLQLVYTSKSARYLAVLSRDGAGHASIYFPKAPEAVRIEAGSSTPLPYSLLLDETTGVETLYALFCDRAEPLEPLRKALEGAEVLEAPAGCHVDRVTFQKRR